MTKEKRVRDITVAITLDGVTLDRRPGESTKDVLKRVRRAIDDGAFTPAVEALSAAAESAGILHDGLWLNVRKPRAI